MTEIQIENVGPISRLDIPLPAEGGVVVLRGKQGTGKSTALRATEGLMGGKPERLTRRDRTVGVGTVHGFGAKLVLGRKTNRSGVVEIEQLEGPGYVSDLVDPGLKEGPAADARRIRALAAITNVDLKPDHFRALLPDDRFDAITAGIDYSNPLEAASLIKREIESVARKKETDRDTIAGALTADRTRVEGIDLDGPTDVEELAGKLETAVDAKRTAAERRRGILEAMERRDDAGKKLEEVKANAPGDTSSGQIIETLAVAERVLTQQRSRFEELESEIDGLRVKIYESESMVDTTREKIQTTKQYEARVSELNIASLVVIEDPPTDEEITALGLRVKTAREQMAAAEQIRDARVVAERIRENETAVRLANDAAVDLRNAAKSVDDVLSSLIASDRMRVMDGRLVTNTEDRGETLYADLSAGERWRLALDVGIDAVGNGGLIVVPQEAWDGLDPENRQAIAEHVHGRKVTVLTASVGDGDLRVDTEDVK